MIRARRSLALPILVWLSMHAAAAGQASLSSEMQATLNRVGADLFSTNPHPAEAIHELKTILSAAVESAEAHMLLGIAYHAQGSPELMSEVVAELRQAIALKPSLTLARLTLARVYLDMARPSRAREELQIALEAMPGNSRILSLLGEAERGLGNARRSVDLNRQALKTDPALTQARYYLGLALLDLKQFPEALAELQQVAETGENPAESFLALGVAHLSAGHLIQAATALAESLRSDPARTETHLHLARVYRLQGRLTEAAKELGLAMPSATSGTNALYRNLDTEFYMEQGLLRMQQGHLEAALESFRNVLQADSMQGEARRRVAELEKRIKNRSRGNKPGNAA